MSSDDGESGCGSKLRLRAEVSDDVFSSWFARMDLEQNAEGVVRLSVPTRFLKSWIQWHYAERRAGLLAGGRRTGRPRSPS